MCILLLLHSRVVKSPIFAHLQCFLFKRKRSNKSLSCQESLLIFYVLKILKPPLSYYRIIQVE